jgi:hypothetical protein
VLRGDVRHADVLDGNTGNGFGNDLLFAKGNEGHEFSDALTDAERRAIIEYMKTL